MNLPARPNTAWRMLSASLGSWSDLV